jgi:hypothetical protein
VRGSQALKLSEAQFRSVNTTSHNMWNIFSRLANTLFVLLRTIWEGFKTVLKTTWDFGVKGWSWIIGIIWMFVMGVSTFVGAVTDMVTTMISKITSWVLPSTSVVQNVSDWLSIANTFAPITEGFVVLSALSVLWASGLVYRFLKSWVPTLS